MNPHLSTYTPLYGHMIKGCAQPSSHPYQHILSPQPSLQLFPQPSKPIELDIEAGNLVLLQKRFQHFKLFDCLRCEFIMPTDHPPSVVVLQFLS